jgi:hypothetical protein
MMSDKPPDPPPRGFVAAMSAVMVAIAILFLYLGVTHAPSFNGPPWVAYVLAVIFLAWGAQALAISLGHAGRGLWLGFIFIAGIAAVFWWISLAGDPRDCAASFGPISLGSHACQIGFGFGAALCTAYAIFVASRLFNRGGRPKSHY